MNLIKGAYIHQGLNFSPLVLINWHNQNGMQIANS